MDLEFSRPFDLSGLESETSVKVSAKPQECAALAERFGLDGMTSFEASLKITPWRGRKGLKLSGSLRGRISQICVVSLEPFDCEVTTAFEELFAHGDPERFLEEFDEADLPTEIDGAGLDLGEIAAEHFALALDPYPRKPGISFEMPGGAPVEEKPESPFAVLKTLKGEGGDDKKG